LTGQAAWFRFVRNGSPWYSVVLGVYSDSAQANRALAALPAQLRRWSPWVRRLGSVQALIRSGSEPPAAGSGSAPAAAAAPPPAPARPVRAADPADLARGQAAFNRGRYAEARRRWQPLADAGQVEAQYNLGFLLESGWGGNKDLAGAARWYARAAVQGHARARYNLGVMFIDGRGAPLDLARGVQLVRMAAEADYPVAAEYLAGCYRSGTCGLERDAQQAARWQERSERQTLVR
jgi:TPR repeat protein